MQSVRPPTRTPPHTLPPNLTSKSGRKRALQSALSGRQQESAAGPKWSDLARALREGKAGEKVATMP